MAAQLLEAHPEIGLQKLDEMAEVDARVHVGQTTRDENLTSLHRSKPPPPIG
jgi:hypothetical protein